MALPLLPKVYKNPGNRQERIKQALDFYKDFHWGTEAEKVARKKVSGLPKVAVKLGKLYSIAYETVKDGEKAVWEHEFGEEGGIKPDLVMDAKTKKLHIVGGTYDVRPEGIID